MATPFLGEIAAFGCNFPPRGWLLCNGQVLGIAQFSALFSLLGTNFGGNGTSNFQIPNLQATSPLGAGQGPGLSSYVLGETAGLPNVTLALNQIPFHNHTIQAAVAAVDTQKTGTPSSQTWLGGSGPGEAYYATPSPPPPPPPPPAIAFSPLAISFMGGGLPHTNTQPVLALNFCIAVSGAFPSRN